MSTFKVVANPKDLISTHRGLKN